MFRKLSDFFKSDSSSAASSNEPISLEVDKAGNPTDHNLHVACVVLLVEMASKDQDIAREEAVTVCNLIANQFNIHENKLPELVEVAVNSRKAQGKINDFVKLINERFNDKQKMVVLAMIWKVVMADGKIDKFEERFAKEMQARLMLSDEQSNKARALAEEGHV